MFKVGDKVIYRQGWLGNAGVYTFSGLARLAGKTATIVAYDPTYPFSNQHYLLQFDDIVADTWWVTEHEIKLVKESEVNK